MKFYSILFVTMVFCNYSFAQCTISFGSTALNLISSSGGNCTYTYSVDVNVTSGNPSVRLSYRCGSTGVFTDLNCIAPGPGMQTLTSTNFTCPCGVIAYGQHGGFTSANCGGQNCTINQTINLTTDKRSFIAINHGTNICYSGSIDASNSLKLMADFEIEKSMDGVSFYSVYNFKQMYSEKFNICLPKDKFSFARLRSIIPGQGNVYSKVIRTATDSPIFAYMQRSNKVLIVPDIQNYLRFEIFNVYGNLIKAGALSTNSIYFDQPTSIYYLKLYDSKTFRLIKFIN